MNKLVTIIFGRSNIQIETTDAELQTLLSTINSIRTGIPNSKPYINGDYFDITHFSVEKEDKGKERFPAWIDATEVGAILTTKAKTEKEKEAEAKAQALAQSKLALPNSLRPFAKPGGRKPL